METDGQSGDRDRRLKRQINPCLFLVLSALIKLSRFTLLINPKYRKQPFCTCLIYCFFIIFKILVYIQQARIYDSTEIGVSFYYIMTRNHFHLRETHTCFKNIS